VPLRYKPDKIGLFSRVVCVLCIHSPCPENVNSNTPYPRVKEGESWHGPDPPINSNDGQHQHTVLGARKLADPSKDMVQGMSDDTD
jgi:hypothetical protein